MVTAKYSMSFTSGALLYHESVKILEFFLLLRQWKKVRENVIIENSIQSRTMNTLKRITSEIISRLKTLNEKEIDFFHNAEYKDICHLLWLALCRRYTFIGDFAVDVIYENFITMKNIVTYEDFMVFFNRKAEWHTEVARIAPSTRRKLRQTLFQMLHEAGLLDKDNMIIPVIPSTGFQKLLMDAERREIMFFPISGLTL